MKIKNPFFTRSRLLWLIPGVLTLITVTYAVIELFLSGIVPAMYLTILIAVCAAMVGLILFLSLRAFRRGKKTARTIAIILSVVMIAASVFGLYVLKRSLATLDSISGDDSSSVKVETSKTFNIFISGIDTYGDISTQSRSDVNIVATVNPVTHKVLLTTAPRDSYVRIALGGNNEYDKLTHAGNYGVESSMKTMANLLDTDIDAYIRINFTSFIESIDTLGGITIDNPTAFTIEGETFPVGSLSLNGKQALLYSRERKSLEGGDVDRGKNQQRVVQGIVNKITTIRSLGGFEALLSMIGSSVQTNLSGSTIRSLINQQISNPSQWATDSYSLTGKGQTGGLPSYAMPGSQLYMYVLDDASVTTAKQRIANEF